MARLIFKAPYYKPGRKAGKGERGAYAKYIAPRDGVELLRSGMADYINERKGSNGLFSDEGMRTAAKTIDRTIGTLAGAYAEFDGGGSEDEQVPTEAPKPTPRTKFEPYKGKYRRQGTGSIHQVSKNVWEGRYSPIVNGKRITRNI